MAAGECVASLAITEPDAGSDMQVETHYFKATQFVFTLPSYLTCLPVSYDKGIIRQDIVTMI